MSATQRQTEKLFLSAWQLLQLPSYQLNYIIIYSESHLKIHGSFSYLVESSISSPCEW